MSILSKQRKEPSLRRSKKIGHKFTEETLASLKIEGDGFLIELEKKSFKKCFLNMERLLASLPDEMDVYIQCVVVYMVIFTVPHVPWDLKPIPVPQALLPKLVDLLKEEGTYGNTEPSMAPYSIR